MTLISQQLKPIRTFASNIHLFLVTAFMIGFVFDGGIYSVIFNLYLLRLNFDTTFVGQINAVGLITFAICSLPSGFLGKYLGSRRMMVIGLIIMTMACLLLPLVEFGPTSWQPNWLILSYGFIFLGLAFYFVNSAPFIMATAQSKQRDQVFAAQVALLALSAFFGSLVGGFLPRIFTYFVVNVTSPAASYRYALLLGSFLLIPAVWAMIATKKTDTAPIKPVREQNSDIAEIEVDDDEVDRPFPLKLVFVLVLTRFFQVAGMAAAIIFFNVYLDTQLLIPTAIIGLLIGFGRLLSVPAALLTPIWAAKYSNVSVVIWASLGVSLAMLPLALVTHWFAASLGFMVAIVCSSVRFPAFLAYSMKVTPARHRAIVAGAGEMAAGFSFAAMSLSGGYIVDTVGYREFFLLAFAFTFLGFLIFFWYFRKPR